MTKRLIDIDDDLLHAAQQAAGQASIKGTVTAALQLLVDAHGRREQAVRARWQGLGDALVELNDDEVMYRAWR